MVGRGELTEEALPAIRHCLAAVADGGEGSGATIARLSTAFCGNCVREHPGVIYPNATDLGKPVRIGCIVGGATGRGIGFWRMRTRAQMPWARWSGRSA